jgi:oleate hydratase
LREGKSVTIEIAPGDLVFVTAGSQVADMSTGDTNSAPQPHQMPKNWALWEKLAKGRNGFGNPAKFFGEEHVKDAKWLTFTVTTTDPAFLDMMEEFSGSEPGRGGIVTFMDSNWLLSVAIFHQPEFTDQPDGVFVWWGFAICPDKPGNFVHKAATDCTGREILEEVLFHLKFQANGGRIIEGSFCIPCVLPYAGSVWLTRNQADRPKVVPDGSTNFAFLGQFAELPDETIFTMEYSVRSAYEAVSKLLKLRDGPPPIYMGHRDPGVLAEVLRTLS